MDKKKCRLIFARFKAQQPEPKTELDYQSAFQLLIAVILSAQATDVSVNKATAKLFAKVDSPAGLLALGEEELKEQIKTIGLYNTKAKNIRKTCQLLLERFNSQVPDTREALESLPGVGRKTANVVLNTIFKQATIAVDTHIFRIAKRIGLSQGNTPLAVELDLLKLIDKSFLQDAHHWLVLHGRYVCTARKPNCQDCLIKDLCEYPNKTA